MRIAASSPTALTIRRPKVAPETTEAAPSGTNALALGAPPRAYQTRYGTPDAGFVMQVIATAAAREDAARPATGIVSNAYGSVRRATQPSPSGSRVTRSI